MFRIKTEKKKTDTWHSTEVTLIRGGKGHYLPELFFQNFSLYGTCYQINIIITETSTMSPTNMQILHIYCTNTVMVLKF